MIVDMAKRLYPAGQHMFSCPDDDQALPEAREYIAKMGFTSENAKIVRRDGFIIVELKEATYV